MNYETGSRDPRRASRTGRPVRPSRPVGSSRPARPGSARPAGARPGARPQRPASRPYESRDRYRYDTYNTQRRDRERYGSTMRPRPTPNRRPGTRPGARNTAYGNRQSRRRRKQQQQRMSLLILIAFIMLIVLIFTLSRCGRNKKPTQEVSAPVDETSSVVEEVPESEPEPAIPTMEGIANVDAVSASATYYYTYGTHFNLTGTTPDIENVRTVHLVLRSLNREEDVYSYEMAWETDGDGIRFESSEMINNGINLEILPTGHYAWLVKIHLRDGSDVYRNIVDETDQETIKYYTITQNDTNREILMENARDSVHNNEYFGVTITECELPDDIYDFVIDAGHGGNDGGAVGGDYTEAELTLKCAFLIKEDLEAMGYKVRLSRDGTEPADEWMAFTMYANPDGRVTKACASRAKFGVSLHLNAVEQDLEIGGLQVYTTARGNYNLAAEIAKEIKANTNCDYSPSTYNKKTDGVYISCEREYDPTDVLANVDALFMIRELGGLATGAYMAGSSTYDPNIYRDSSQGVEALLLELGYITEEKDREDIANNTDGYAQGISNALDTIAKQAAFPEDAAQDDDSSESSVVIPVTPQE